MSLVKKWVKMLYSLIGNFAKQNNHVIAIISYIFCNIGRIERSYPKLRLNPLVFPTKCLPPIDKCHLPTCLGAVSPSLFTLFGQWIDSRGQTVSFRL